MRHPGSLALVALGGTAGVGAREALTLSASPLFGMPDGGHLPWAVITANIVGAFLLGLLTGALAHRRAIHHTTPRGRALRLLLGIGFCGGFTTYSTFAVGLVLLAQSAGPAVAAGWAVGIVTAGALATWLGMALGAGGKSPSSGAHPAGVQP